MSVPRRVTRASLKSLGAKIRERRRLRRGDLAVRITVHRGSEASDRLAQEVHDTLVVSCLRSGRRDVHVAISGGFGPRSEEILVTVESALGEPVTYGRTDAKAAREIFLHHVMHGEVLRSHAWIRGLPDPSGGTQPAPGVPSSIPHASEHPFFTLQRPWTLRRRGRIDPVAVEDALAHDAYLGLARALFDLQPEQIIDEVERAGLLEASGLDRPLGDALRACVKPPADPPVIVCEPGREEPENLIFRGILESDPHAVLEGMAISARATGAHQGFLVCSGLPLVAERLEQAVLQAQALGLLGSGILGTGFSFSVTPKVEDLADEPEMQSPILRLDAETLAALGALLHLGAETYRRQGTTVAPGTKLLTLGGRCRTGGLVEVPFGLSLRRIVEELGGGVCNDRRPKAVHLGGTDGTLVPESQLDLELTPSALREAGLSLGNGSLLLLSEEDPLVEFCRLLLGLRGSEHAAECASCHAGTERLTRLLDKMSTGAAVPDDLQRLEELANALREEPECPRCRALPLTLLGALDHFRPELDARIRQPLREVSP